MTTLSADVLAVVENVLDDLSQTLRTAREGDMGVNPEARIGRDAHVALGAFHRPIGVMIRCLPAGPI
jgi:hypothetical protein